MVVDVISFYAYYDRILNMREVSYLPKISSLSSLLLKSISVTWFESLLLLFSFGEIYFACFFLIWSISNSILGNVFLFPISNWFTVFSSLYSPALKWPLTSFLLTMLKNASGWLMSFVCFQNLIDLRKISWRYWFFK